MRALNDAAFVVFAWAVTVRQERRRGSAVAFRVPRGATVTALGGVVITLKAGRVQFREWVHVRNAAGRVGWTDEPDAFTRPEIG